MVHIRGRALIRCYILMHFISAADRYTRVGRIIIIYVYNTCGIRNEMEKKLPNRSARTLRQRIHDGYTTSGAILYRYP